MTGALAKRVIPSSHAHSHVLCQDAMRYGVTAPAGTTSNQTLSAVAQLSFWSCLSHFAYAIKGGKGDQGSKQIPPCAM